MPDQVLDEKDQALSADGEKGTNRGQVPESSESTSSPEELLSTWIQGQLASERATFLDKLQLILQQKITDHHTALLGTVSEHFTQSFSCSGREAVEQEPEQEDRMLQDFADNFADSSDPSRATKQQRTCSTAISSRGAKPLRPSVVTYHRSRSYQSKLIASLAQDEDTGNNTIRDIVTSSHFELTFTGLIFVNVIIMAMEVQYMGCRLAAKMNHPDCSAADSVNPQIENFFTITAIFFALAFSAEYAMRLVHLRSKAYADPWMWFDSVVLIFGITDTIARASRTSAILVNPVAMRVARVVRALRIIKFVRSKVMFQTLFLLVRSIVASRHTLVWFILILYLAMTCVGLIVNQLLYSYLDDINMNEHDRYVIYEYFGTYSRMMITMLEITLGNWAPPCRELMQKISQWWGIAVIFYRCIFCFSLVHVTSAVFIAETSRVAADDRVTLMHKVQKDKHLGNTLVELFKEIDTSGDGFMSVDELREACNDKVMKDLMEMLDLDVRDVEELFALMDSGTGQVRQEEFIDGILQLRGVAKCSRQVSMMKLIKDVHLKIDALEQSIPRQGRLFLANHKRSQSPPVTPVT